jgi:LysR family transcriptional regulator of abg operon
MDAVRYKGGMREAHLRDFIAVVETGSVRAAARRLKLTQSAVSKNLTALERALGVPLLLRSAHGIELTEHGRATLRHARVVDAEFRHLREELDQLSGQRHGLVSVGISGTAEALMLPGALDRFRRSAPGIQVSLFGGRSATTLAALREARVDFVIGPLPPDHDGSDIHVERLCSSELGVCARSDHPAAGCGDLADLLPYPWVYAVRHAEGEIPIQTMFRARGLGAPELMVHSDSNSALVALLLQSDMLTLTSVESVAPLLRAGLLRVLPLDLGLPPVVQNLLTLTSRPLTTPAAALAAEFRRVSRRLRR